MLLHLGGISQDPPTEQALLNEGVGDKYEEIGEEKYPPIFLLPAKGGIYLFSGVFPIAFSVLYSMPFSVSILYRSVLQPRHTGL